MNGRIDRVEKEIKRCPFCNGNARASVRQQRFLGWNGLGTRKIEYAAQVICNKCHARGGVATGVFVTGCKLNCSLELLKNIAVNMWNMREGQ